MKRALRIFGRGCIALVIVLAVLYGVLHTEWGRGKLAQKISAVVSARMEGEFELSGISGWLPFSLAAERVVCSTPAGTPWLDLEQVAVTANARSLRERRILLDQVTVVQATYRPRPRTTPSKKSTPWDAIPSGAVSDLTIEALRLENDSGPRFAPLRVEAGLDHGDAHGGSRLDVAVTNAQMGVNGSLERANANAPWLCRVAAAVTTERLPGWMAQFTETGASGVATLRKPRIKPWVVDTAHVVVGDHQAELEIALPAPSGPWSVGFDGVFGEFVHKEIGVRSAKCRGRVRGGEGIEVELEAAPRGLRGLPADLLAGLGSEPTLSAVLNVASSRVDVAQCRVNGALGEVDIRGSVVPRSLGFDVSWRASLQGLGRLPSLSTRPRAAPLQPVVVTGELSSARWKDGMVGALQAEDLTFADGGIRLIDVQFSSEAPPNLESLRSTVFLEGLEAKQAAVERAEITYARGRVLLTETTVRVGPGTIRLGGEADAQGLQAEAVLQELPLADVPKWEEITGTAAGSLRIGGTWEAPQVSANLRVTEVASREAVAEVLKPVDGVGELTVSNGLLHAEAHFHTRGDDRLEMKTDLPVTFRLVPWTAALTEQGVGHVSVRGRLDLDALNALPVMAEQQLSGILELDLSAEGSPRSPRFQGTGRIREGRYEHFVMGTDLRNLKLLMEADDRDLIIRSLSADDGTGGRLQGSGQMALRPQKGFPFRFDLQLLRTQLLANDLLTGTAEGAIWLEGTAGGMNVGGNLALAPVRIQIPNYLPLSKPAYTVVDSHRPSPIARRARAGRGIALDVQVDVPARMTVRGRGLESEWGGKVRVKGSAADPLITGQIRSLRGRFNFFGQPFTLSESTLQFTGQSPPRPALDITFERRRSERTAYLKIGGTTAEPKLDLTSDPILPNDELLPLVLFGKDIRDVSPLQAVRMAQAARALQGGGSAFDFMGHAQRLLAVDQLNIEQADSAEGVAKVTAGKYLSDRVYIEGQNEVGPDNGRISLEVELTPRVSLETDIGAEMSQGVGLKFKRHF